jgi:hypothetical protein
MALVALFTGIAPPFIAGSRSGRSRTGQWLAYAAGLTRISAAGRKARPPKPGAHDAAPLGYLSSVTSSRRRCAHAWYSSLIWPQIAETVDLEIAASSQPCR